MLSAVGLTPWSAAIVEVGSGVIVNHITVIIVNMIIVIAMIKIRSPFYAFPYAPSGRRRHGHQKDLHHVQEEGVRILAGDSPRCLVQLAMGHTADAMPRAGHDVVGIVDRL